MRCEKRPEDGSLTWKNAFRGPLQAGSPVARENRLPVTSTFQDLIGLRLFDHSTSVARPLLMLVTLTTCLSPERVRVRLTELRRAPAAALSALVWARISGVTHTRSLGRATRQT